MDSSDNYPQGNCGKGAISNSEPIGRYSQYKILKEASPAEKYLSKQTVDHVDNKTKLLSEYFIVPADDAVYQEKTLNAFDYYPEILLDFINMAKTIKRSNEIEIANQILNYCNRYGLFNISALYSVDFGIRDKIVYNGKNYFKYDYYWVLLSQVGMKALYGREGESEFIHVLDFADIFFPKLWNRYAEFMEDKDGLESKLKNNYFCEPLEYLVKEISLLYCQFEPWFDRTSIDENTFGLIERLSANPTTAPVTVSIDYNRTWKLKWIYKSLIDALNIMFIKNIIEMNQRVLFCQNCHSSFITRRKIHKYCSLRCNNAARQRKWYSKRKKKNREL